MTGTEKPEKENQAQLSLVSLSLNFIFAPIVPPLIALLAAGNASVILSVY